jgi:hypothetical protein
MSRPIIGCVGYDQTHSFISSHSSYLSYRSPLTCRRVASFVFHVAASAAFTGQYWWRSFMAPRLPRRKFCLRIPDGAACNRKRVGLRNGMQSAFS